MESEEFSDRRDATARPAVPPLRASQLESASPVSSMSIDSRGQCGRTQRSRSQRPGRRVAQRPSSLRACECAGRPMHDAEPRRRRTDERVRLRGGRSWMLEPTEGRPVLRLQLRAGARERRPSCGVRALVVGVDLGERERERHSNVKQSGRAARKGGGRSKVLPEAVGRRSQGLVDAASLLGGANECVRERLRRAAWVVHLSGRCRREQASRTSGGGGTHLGHTPSRPHCESNAARAPFFPPPPHPFVASRRGLKVVPGRSAAERLRGSLPSLNVGNCSQLRVASMCSLCTL